MRWSGGAAVLGTAADGAMRGDSFRASQGFNLGKPLTGLLGPDALPTATARKCSNSSGMALALIATCHDARASCAGEGVFRLHNYSPGR